MQRNESPALFKVTGHAGRLHAWAILLFVGVGIAVASKKSVWLVDAHPWASFVVGVVGWLVIAVSFIAPWFGSRCPKCRVSWFRWAMTKNPGGYYGNWSWLYAFKECPRCGYRAEAEESAI